MAKKKPEKEIPATATALADVPLKTPRGMSLLLQVGLITLPIRLSPGARAEGVNFKKLHSVCLGPMKQQETAGTMYCPLCAENVPKEEQVRGYEVSKGRYVALTEKEIEAQKPDTDKLVLIDTFVPAEEIDPIYFESSYYLSPAEGGARPFVLVREMLKRTGKVALGKATLYGSEHTVILRHYGSGLALHQMFLLPELNQIAFGVDTVVVSAQELSLAEKLVEQLTSNFDPKQYHNRYLANIEALVASKEAGTAPKLPERLKKGPVAVDLMAALSQSVDAARKRRVA